MPRFEQRSSANSLFANYAGPRKPPSPQQIKFHTDPATYRLYGGAKGGGQSLALLWEGVKWCLRVPGANVLLLRRTFPELNKGLIRHFELDIPPAVYGGRRHYNASEHTVTFQNGSKLFFASCQHEKDVMAFQGQEFVFIGIDEATEWTFEMFEFLTLQNRCPVKRDIDGHEVVPCMALGSNPGGIGHPWVKALFIGEKQDDGTYKRTEESVRKRIPEMSRVTLSDYSFIPAKVFDNPAYATDEKYLDKLKTANKAWKDRYLYGSWETFEGSYFEKYDPAETKIDKWMARRLVESQPWQAKWLGIDWGYNHWASVFWFATVEISDTDGQKRDVTLVYRELVVRQAGEKELGRNIVELTGKEKISAVYLSPDAFAKRGAQNTIAEQIGEVLVASHLPYPDPADDDRVGGARLMDQLLSLRPCDLLISEDCGELLESIPLLQVDEKNREDVKKTELKSDDIYDGCRYGLKSKLGGTKTPWEIERERALTACTTPQEKFWTDLALQQRKKQTKVVRFMKPRTFGAFNA